MTQRPLFAACIATIALIIGLSLPVVGADWPVYRGPSHNGFSSETDWKADWGSDGPKVLWKASIGLGFSCITVANGKAYMMGNDNAKSNPADVVVCVDALTGKQIWKFAYQSPLQPKYYEGGTLSSPTVDGGMVYTLSKMGELYCLNAETGKVVWHKQMNKDLGFALPTWHFAGSPVVLGDLLVLDLGDAGVGLNKANGDLVWENGKGVCGYSTPVPCKFGGQDAVCIASADTIVGVEVKDGKVLWATPFENKHKVTAGDAIVVGNEVFASCGYNRGCIKVSVNGGAVKLLNDSTVMRNHTNCSIFYKDHIYGFDMSMFKCIDFGTIEENWAEKSLGMGAFIMATDGRMIIMSETGELVIAQADPAGYKELTRARILPKAKCWTAPTLANGLVYARNVIGDAVCVSLK